MLKSFSGGKGVHVAMRINELKEECCILAFWGGLAGKWIQQLCSGKGISCYGPEIDESNRTCLTLCSDGGLDGTEILEPGPFINEEEINLY